MIVEDSPLRKKKGFVSDDVAPKEKVGNGGSSLLEKRRETSRDGGGRVRRDDGSRSDSGSTRTEERRSSGHYGPCSSTSSGYHRSHADHHGASSDHAHGHDYDRHGDGGGRGRDGDGKTSFSFASPNKKEPSYHEVDESKEVLSLQERLKRSQKGYWRTKKELDDALCRVNKLEERLKGGDTDTTVAKLSREDMDALRRENDRLRRTEIEIWRIVGLAHMNMPQDDHHQALIDRIANLQHVVTTSWKEKDELHRELRWLKSLMADNPPPTQEVGETQRKLNDQVERLKEATAKTEAELADLQKAHKSLTEFNKESVDEKRRWRQKCEKLTTQLTDIREALQTSTSKQSKLKEKVAVLEADNERLKTRLARGDGDSKKPSIKEPNNTNNNQMASIQRENDRLKIEVAQTKELLKTEQDGMKAHMKKIRLLEKQKVEWSSGGPTQMEVVVENDSVEEEVKLHNEENAMTEGLWRRQHATASNNGNQQGDDGMEIEPLQRPKHRVHRLKEELSETKAEVQKLKKELVQTEKDLEYINDLFNCVHVSLQENKKELQKCEKTVMNAVDDNKLVGVNVRDIWLDESELAECLKGDKPLPEKKFVDLVSRAYDHLEVLLRNEKWDPFVRSQGVVICADEEDHTLMVSK